MRDVVRVLRPGGWVAVLDAFHGGSCVEPLERLGMVDIRISALRWRICPPARLVTAQRPFTRR